MKRRAWLLRARSLWHEKRVVLRKVFCVHLLFLRNTLVHEKALQWPSRRFLPKKYGDPKEVKYVYVYIYTARDIRQG